jgi:prepilin-type N-terminal cleavage/methylation domain-containing protein|tara:strand:- start:982 stop:1476 length:495 start_codon:yes stop_codon:yes gene_type:complete
LDFTKLINSKGFTLLELLVALILIGIISTITLTNSGFLKSYQSDQINSYSSLIEYLSEESALTKKNIGWFVGNGSQFIATFRENEWQANTEVSNMLPMIESDTEFQDSLGNLFYVDESRDDPFLIFYPSGHSSGGTIQYNRMDNELILSVNSFSAIEIISKENR